MIIFLALIFLTPSLAFSGILTFKIGFFVPQAQSDLWDIEFENMNFGKTHFYNSGFAFSYEYFLTRELSFTIGVDSYTKNKGGIYEDYIGIVGTAFGEPYYDFAFPPEYQSDFFPDDVFNIFHSFSVSITPIQFSLKLTPLGRKGKIIPYIGGGVGVYLWYVRIRGDIVDFDDPWIYTDPIAGDITVFSVDYWDLREDSRITIGYHGFAGMMLPVAQRFSVEVELKYNYVQGKFREEDESFEGFDPFDLSGYQFSVGLNYWF